MCVHLCVCAGVNIVCVYAGVKIVCTCMRVCVCTGVYIICVCVKGGRGGVYFVSFFPEDGLNHFSLILNVLGCQMTY